MVAALLAALLSASAQAAGTALEDVVSRLGHTRWTAGNTVRLLTGPEDAWQARLDLIGQARHHIFISTYAWHNDRFGRAFAHELERVARERREADPTFTVYCLVDATAAGIYNWWSYSFDKLREAGVELRAFNPSAGSVTALYDGRLHDKMVIVDGRAAIVGGRNLAEEYYDPESWWLDLGVLVRGEAVHDMQTSFLKAWVAAQDLARPVRFFQPEETSRRRIHTLFETGRFPHGRRPLERYLNPEFFPDPEVAATGVPVAVLYDNSLAWRRARSTDVAVELVRRARREIDLMTPFPNLVEELTVALEQAVGRGVRVRLVVNGEGAAIRRGPFWLAGLPTLIRMIRAGGEVWAWNGDGALTRELERIHCDPEHMPPIALHGKALRIDGDLTLITSSNFNIRSTYYNSEAGAAVLDPGFNRGFRDFLDGLIRLHELDVECAESPDAIAVERVVRRLTEDDIPRLRKTLGGKQRFLDAMGGLW